MFLLECLSSLSGQNFYQFLLFLPILPVNLIFFTILPVNFKAGKSSTLFGTGQKYFLMGG
jgi:hypothetical protein